MNCPNCNNEIQPKWKACPFCSEKLPQKKSCSNCAKELNASWKACPFCGKSADTDQISTVTIQDSVMKSKEFVGREKILIQGESQIATKKGDFCRICGVLLKDEYYRCAVCGYFCCSNCRNPYNHKCTVCDSVPPASTDEVPNGEVSSPGLIACPLCSEDGKVLCEWCFGKSKECSICGGLGHYPETCPLCNGYKKVEKGDLVDCIICDGTGLMKCNICKGTGKCDSCNGTGKCDRCNGTGKCLHCNGAGEFINNPGTGYESRYNCVSCGNWIEKGGLDISRGTGRCVRCDGRGQCGCDGGQCWYCDGKGTRECYYCKGARSLNSLTCFWEVYAKMADPNSFWTEGMCKYLPSAIRLLPKNNQSIASKAIIEDLKKRDVDSQTMTKLQRLLTVL